MTSNILIFNELDKYAFEDANLNRLPTKDTFARSIILRCAMENAVWKNIGEPLHQIYYDIKKHSIAVGNFEILCIFALERDSPAKS